MKKLMSWLLVFAMLLSFVPAGVSAEEGFYTVAGTEELCGSAWTPADTNNQMHLNEDGLYEITYFNVPEGHHEFKVTDGTWDNSWGTEGNNFGFDTTGINNVTITFDANHELAGQELNFHIELVEVQ